MLEIMNRKARRVHRDFLRCVRIFARACLMCAHTQKNLNQNLPLPTMQNGYSFTFSLIKVW